MTSPILDTIDRSARVIFYPSSCKYSDDFQDVPYDVVVLNSKTITRKEKKGKVYCLNFDNNELLGMFAANNVRLSAIVIIRDGCAEGGNYECIAGHSFLGRLMPVVADQFDYFTDHRRFPKRVPAHFVKFETPIYLDPFVNNSEPLSEVRAFHVTMFPVIEREFVLGRIRVTIIRDTIWRDFNRSDLMVVKIDRRRCAIPNYLKGWLPVDLTERFEFVSQSSCVTSIEHFLQIADARKFSRLSLMPIAKGSYENIVSEIQDWKRDYPREIFFYHLNANDFVQLRSMDISAVK